MNGFILVDKEKGMTSFDVVFKLRKQLGIKKMGHTGTLDPDTEGLLVVAVGKATKFIPILSESKQKEYTAEITLGSHTDTYDSSGTVLEENDVPELTEKQIDAILAKFIGKQSQMPPIYSAKKVNGKRLYDYARNGEEVEIKPQEIEVFDIKRTSEYSENKFMFDSLVSKGTYIRSLIVDIAKELGTLGHMSYLKRTKTDGFDVKDAKKISDITVEDIYSLEDFVLANYPNVEIYGPIANLIKNGARLRIHEGNEYPCVYIDKETKKPIAIYDIADENTKPILMF